MRHALISLLFLAACGGGSVGDDAAVDGGAPVDGHVATDAPGSDTGFIHDMGVPIDFACATDADGDGHVAMSCGGDDCDDGDANRFPGNVETCDGMDHDEDCEPSTFGMRDADGDGHVDATCCNGSPTGPMCGDDCDDSAIGIHPTAPEVCNGADDNCDGMVDEGVMMTFFADCDADGYGGPESMVRCAAPTTPPTACPGALWIGVGGDCDDSRAATHPTGTETCNSVDDDCNSTVDDGADSWCASTGLPHAATATCSAGTCVLGTCGGAFLDCGSAPGCETDGSTDHDNCGTCGHGCAFSCNASGCDDAVEVRAGGDHTCVRRASGTVLCWGQNLFGQLGDGTTMQRLTPTLVPGITDAVEIAAGNTHTCVRHATGTVSCWGSDDRAQCGDGVMSFSPRLSPVAVVGITNAVQIAADDIRTCALLATGSVMCWGGGAIGDGIDRLAPTAVPSLTNAMRIATGRNHTCAVRTTGTVACWGGNLSGQLGDGTTTARTTPTTVTGVTGAIGVTAGDSFTCAVLGLGAGVMCWGANFHGQLGDGSTTERHTAVAVIGSDGIDQISAMSIALSAGHVCAHKVGGDLVCWGANGAGQLGDGTTTDAHDAGGTTFLLGVDQVTAGSYHSCALAFGSLQCWGANAYGQLGDGTTTDSTGPSPVVRP